MVGAARRTLPPHGFDFGDSSGDSPIEKAIRAQSSFYYKDDPTIVKVKVVPSAALGVAEAKQNPSPWTWNMFKLYLIISVCLSFQCLNGYSNGARSAVDADERYLKYFGFDPERKTPLDNLYRNVRLIGSLVGLLFAPILVDLRGRKWGMFGGALAFILFTIPSACATTPAQLAVARVLNSWGNSVYNIAVWTYGMEIAHPSYRGPMVGMLNCFYFVGQAPGVFVPYATSKLANDWSWRIPIWCEAFFPLLALPFFLVIPESPRWLFANGREKEALEIMTKYHGDGNPDAAIIHLQLEEMRSDISLSGSDKRWWDYRDLFNTREARYRTWQSFATGLIGGWSGSNTITAFYSYMLSGVGIGDEQTKRFIFGIQTPVLFVIAISGALLSDRVRRRRAFYSGALIFAAIMAVVAALSATNMGKDASGEIITKSESQTKAFIAMIYLFQIVHSFLYTPLQVMYPLECLRFSVRAKGYAFTSIARTPFTFYESLVTGIAFNNIGWKYYLWYVAWNIMVAVFVFRYCVETSGRTLEELTEIFRSKYPVKTSLSKSKVVVQGDEIIVHEVERVYD